MGAIHTRCKPTTRLALILFVSCQIAEATDFLPQIKLLVSGKPIGVATGDFNGDGKADIVIAQMLGKNINVILNNGDGTFRPAVNYPVGAQPVSVAVADLNRDGKLDLIVAEQAGSIPGQVGNTVGVLLGNGDGTFQPDASYLAGPHPVVVTTGDFNGDGILDVAVANSGTKQAPASIVVLLGKGDGSLQVPGITDTQRVTLPTGIAAGDFNGDGKLDLATSNANGTTAVAVRFGNGDGSFRAPVTLDTHNDAATVAVGDLNGDGNLDVVSYTYTTFTLSVFLGNGHGKFQAAKKYPPHAFIGSVAIGDFDGDGKADLAVIQGAQLNTVGVLPGVGDGTFGTEEDFAVGTFSTAVAIGDFVGHGARDLVVANRDGGTVSVLINASP